MRRVDSKRGKRKTGAAISQAVLTRAAVAVSRMTFDERQTLADEIYLQQPNLLASVVVQHEMGASLPQAEDLLNILLVAYQAMKISGHHWPVISEDDQDLCMQRLTGKMQFIEGLGATMVRRAVGQQIEQHPEPCLLAFVYGQLEEHDLLGIRTDIEQNLVLTALNLVECIGATVQARDSHKPRP